MPDWSRRTAISTAGSCVAIAIAGCLNNGTDIAQPEYDCSRVSRPEPNALEDPDAVSPGSYPDPPDDAGAEAALTEYVENFERAYRRNRLVASEGSALIRFGFSPRETWVVDSSSGAGVGGVQYTYWFEIDKGGITHFDSSNQVAVYYVDESVAVRAHEEGRRDAGIEPDPREAGVEVACFE